MNTNLWCVVLAVVVPLCLGDQASDRTDNSVELEFHRLQTTDWDTYGMQTKVAAILASGANTYCSSNPAACGLSSCCTGTAFKEINIGKADNTPLNEEKNMLFTFYIDLPDGAFLLSNGTYVLTSAVVINIVESVRMDIFNSIGYYVIWADEKYFGVPPQTTENIVISIVGFVVLFIIIAVALFLHFWNKRREHNEKLQKKIDMRKNKKKKKDDKDGEEAPTYKIETETSVPKPPDNKLKSVIYGGENVAGASKLDAQKEKDVVPKEKADTAPRSNGNVDESAVRHRSPKNLPPLGTSEPVTEKDEDREERRKRRKAKKKHRKSKRTAAENSGYHQSDDEDGYL